MKILTIVGARPQFIKAAIFSRKFRENQKNTEILVHTGQHYDKNMSDIFFEELKIPKPDYNLGVGSCSHGEQTARILEKTEKIIIQEKPDAVLLYGDTNSTLAGALAASKLLIPVFHIEAGLRSYDMNMPEEQNRILTDHLSTLLFCPTDNAVKCLKHEGIVNGVHNVGDIMYEAVLNYIKVAEEKYNKKQWLSEVKTKSSLIKHITSKNYYLATIHRPYNTDNPNNMINIFKAFNHLDKPVLMPLHPRTKRIIEKLNVDLTNIIILEPLGYLLMLYLTKNAYMVITDSGGLQKETYFLKTPGIILRNTTEWKETLEDGWNVTCDIDSEKILKSSKRELNCLSKQQSNKFGDGKTSEKIVEIMEEYFSKAVKYEKN